MLRSSQNITNLTGPVTSVGNATALASSTGSGGFVLQTSPALVTPALGTPASGVLTNATGLPLTTGITGTLGVANGGTGSTTATGTGAGVRQVSPTLTTPILSGAGSTALIALYNVTATLTPAAVAANTTAEQTFAVAAVAVGDTINVNKPTSQAGLGIVGVRVASAGNIGITFANVTAAAITPTATEVYQISGIR